MKHILVALDMSGADERVVQHALPIAKAFGAHLSLLHVAAPEPDFVGFEVGPQYVRDHRADALRSEHRHIQALAAMTQAQGVETLGRLVQGPTVETLLAEAAELPADLIVVGSHGHGTFYKAFVGSVSDELLRSGRFPILVVPVADDQA
ncbi:MAG: universal stress protein [Flavobacteriales bacterium]|jgi:nucleotide-binding universal stress UspA family protein|nr:universal stress protein [Flavobacteriales bacterium]